jgi:hypothetical protein
MIDEKCKYPELTAKIIGCAIEVLTMIQGVFQKYKVILEPHSR